jgi:hypothetical protein
MVARLPDERVRLEKMVEYSCRILTRTRPIHAVIRGAADKEPFAAALGKRLLHDRLTNQTVRIRQYLGKTLREGLSVGQAGQRYCALTSPELYQMLTVEFGWTAEQHREWITTLLEAELLQPS